MESHVRSFARSRMGGRTYHGVDRLFVFHHGVYVCMRVWEGEFDRIEFATDIRMIRIRALRYTSVTLLRCYVVVCVRCALVLSGG